MADIRCTFTHQKEQYCVGIRIPTETSGRSVRESDCMLGWVCTRSANVCATLMVEYTNSLFYVVSLWRQWKSAARSLANSLSHLMLLKPNACTLGRPDEHIGMNRWLHAICALKRNWSDGKQHLGGLSVEKTDARKDAAQKDRSLHWEETCLCRKADLAWWKVLGGCEAVQTCLYYVNAYIYILKHVCIMYIHIY